MSTATAAALVSALVAAGAAMAGPVPPPLPVVAPERAGMSAERLARIDAAIADSIARREVPGAVVLVGRRGEVVFRKAYGHRALAPSKEEMTPDTVFDVASLTKPVATAMSVMTLVDAGRLRLGDPVVKVLPEFGAGGGEREKVTVEQLLLHRGGLVADDPMAFYTGTPGEILARKHLAPLAASPGARFVYSDAGFEVLGEVVRAVSGVPLDRYAQSAVFAPLGMTSTGFRPGGEGTAPVSCIAPTERRGDAFLRGTVHDPRARAVGGVAGHAGLFSTADDLARLCRALLAGGAPVLSPAATAAMTRPRFFPDLDVRALGWDVATHYSTSRGDLFPLGSYGHTGFTGTSLWIDGTTGVFVILLSNRDHPDTAGNAVPPRALLATLAAAAVTDVPAKAFAEASLPIAAIGASARPLAAGKPRGAAPAAAAAEVRTGIDVLEAKGFAPIAGKKVALVTNQTGRTRDGRSTIDVLLSEKARAAGVALVRLFSPEHGLAGLLDEKVPDGKDEVRGLAIRSLYGESRRPAPGDLEGLDAVVVDLQDAGCRFYTYLTTMAYVMEEAAKVKLPVVVLDRPNPIGAVVAEGPLADPAKLSFIAYHPIPVRTGMTIGELARLFDAERAIGAALTVVPMEGYRPSLWYDETGLPWVNPSPNLRSVTQAALYPGVALLEFTNVSVGRGTDSPFEVVGAPWMDGRTLARTLSSRSIPGVRFTPVSFTPASSTHAGKICQGVRITVVDRTALRSVSLGAELMTAIRALHGKEWDRKRLGELLASPGALVRLERGEPATQIVNGWAAELMDFELRRIPHLLYPRTEE